MVKPKCACGCGQRAANRHHIVYQQTLRDVARSAGRRGFRRRDVEVSLTTDRRNLMWLAFDCHMAHHGRSKVLPLVLLPDEAFEFARETLGAGVAYETLRRAYRGTDVRLDALLEMAA